MKKQENFIQNSHISNSIFYHPPPKCFNSFHNSKTSSTVQTKKPTEKRPVTPLKTRSQQTPQTSHKKNNKSVDITTPIYIVNNKKNYIIYNDIKLNTSLINTIPLIYSPSDSEKKRLNNENKKTLNDHYLGIFQNFKINTKAKWQSNNLQTPSFKASPFIVKNEKINNNEKVKKSPINKQNQNEARNNVLITENIDLPIEKHEKRQEREKEGKKVPKINESSGGDRNFQASKAIEKENKQNSGKARWDPVEDNNLLIAYEKFKKMDNKKTKKWEFISSICNGRNPSQCKQRYKRLVKPDNVRKKWTELEDKFLRTAVEVEKLASWEIIADKLKLQGFNRTGKQVRERYINHLDPNINTQPFKPDEDALIIEYFKIYGNKWAKIARHLVHRSENAVKNRFHYHLKKLIYEEVKPSLQKEEYLMNKIETESFSDEGEELPELDEERYREIFGDPHSEKEIKYKKIFSAESEEAYKDLKNNPNAFDF